MIADPAAPPLRTWVRAGWLVGLVYAVAQATRPGASGRHLAAAVLTAATAVGWTGWLVARHRASTRTTVASLLLLTTAGGVMVVLNPIGIAVVALAGMCAASLFELVPAAAVTAPGVLASLVAVVATGHAAGVVASAASGAAAGLVVGTGRRQSAQRIRQEAQLAVAHQHAELERARAEVLAERTAVAREVHDVLAHTLGALSVQLEALGSILADDRSSDEARTAAARSRRLVTEGIEETRRAVRVLRDEPVDVAEQVASLADDRVSVTLDGDARTLPPAAGLALVRVAQEAVTNARKHAAGAPVRVLLSFSGNAAGVTVDNDAADPSPLAATGAGYGLQGMRERVELVGGTLTAGPHDRGWRVWAEVPT